MNILYSQLKPKSQSKIFRLAFLISKFLEEPLPNLLFYDIVIQDFLELRMRVPALVSDVTFVRLAPMDAALPPSSKFPK